MVSDPLQQLLEDEPVWYGGAVEFALEIAISANEPPDAGHWQPATVNLGALWAPPGEGVWSGTRPDWEDYSDRLMQATIRRGRDRWEQQFKAGSASVVVDNQDGAFTPDSPNALPLLRPGRWLRIRGRLTDGPGDWETLFTGQIDALEDVYISGAAGINTRITCLDFAARFQIDDPPALETPIPAGDATGFRVTRILDSIEWPDDPLFRDIAPGINTMSESTLAQSRWQELQTAAEAEGGGLYISRDGVVTFRDRDWITNVFQGSPKFTVGFPASNVDVLDADTDWSQQRVYNDIQMSRVGGSVYRVTDEPSIDFYGPRTYRRLDLECETDAQIEFLADRFLGAFRVDKNRIESLELGPRPDPGKLEAGIEELLAVELGDYIRAQIQTRGEGLWSYAGDYIVNKIDHVITGDGDWAVALRVDLPAIPLDEQTPFTAGFDAGFDSPPTP